MLYGKELIEDIKKQIASTEETIADRHARIAEGSTDMDDCFVSQRVNETGISLCKMKLDILNNKGVSKFPCLRDAETGEIVAKKTGRSQYGSFYIILDKYKNKFGSYISATLTEKTYAKRGVVVSTHEAPAWVKLEANGKGMYGAYSATPVIFQSSVNFFTGERVEIN